MTQLNKYLARPKIKMIYFLQRILQILIIKIITSLFNNKKLM